MMKMAPGNSCAGPRTGGRWCRGVSRVRFWNEIRPLVDLADLPPGWQASREEVGGCLEAEEERAAKKARLLISPVLLNEIEADAVVQDDPELVRILPGCEK